MADKTNKTLQEARKKKGFTQEFMAKVLGYRSKSGYANIELGLNEPSVTVALKIAELVEEEVGVLFGALVVHDTRTSDEQAASSA